MNRTHYAEDDLILFFYGEGRRRDAVRRHLDECPACAAVYADIAATMKLVAAPEAPERDDRYGLEVWQRIRPVLPMQPPSHAFFWWPFNRLALAAATVALVVAAFFAGRAWPVPQAPGDPAVAGGATLASDSGAAKCIDCGWTSPTELIIGAGKQKNPAPPKRDTGSCVLSLAEFVERPQAGTNRRFPEV
jgi:anti-sigma factor RsiW